jgi:hypothetical protein
VSERTDIEWDKLVAATASLAADNIPSDVQELLLYGNPDRGIRPGALERAINAAAPRR